MPSVSAFSDLGIIGGVLAFIIITLALVLKFFTDKKKYSAGAEIAKVVAAVEMSRVECSTNFTKMVETLRSLKIDHETHKFASAKIDAEVHTNARIIAKLDKLVTDIHDTNKQTDSYGMPRVYFKDSLVEEVKETKQITEKHSVILKDISSILASLKSEIALNTTVSNKLVAVVEANKK